MPKREETKTYRIPNLEKAFAALEAIAAARSSLRELLAQTTTESSRA